MYGRAQPTLIETGHSALRHTLLCCAHTVTFTRTRYYIRNTPQQILQFLQKIGGVQKCKTQKDYVSIPGMGDDQLRINLKSTIYDQLTLFHCSLSY